MFKGFLQDTFGLDQPISPVYLVAFVAVAWAVFRWQGGRRGFLGWLLPRQIWAHRSTRIDLSLYAMTRVMSLFGILALFTAVPAIAAMVADALPFGPRGTAGLSPLALGAIFWIFGDFAVYLTHWAHHRFAVLWPLHAVHHSAEVLTPITAYRQHPLDMIVATALQSVILGVALGVLVGTLAPQTTVAQIAGVNTFTVISILAMANFHHSHIRISYGPVLERFLISPAQHQIHHSNDEKHFNKNFGGTLALWDWLFGTLYISRPGETVTFGLNHPDDAPLMTQRLWPVLFDPVRRMVRPRR